MLRKRDQWALRKTRALLALYASVAIEKEHHIAPSARPRRLPRQSVDWLPEPLGQPMAYVLADDLGWHILDVLATVELDFATDVTAHPVEEAELMTNAGSFGAVVEDARDRRQLGEVDNP
jgi:hypothetical protein